MVIDGEYWGYLIRDDGEVISMKYGTPRKLRPKKEKNGYFRVALSYNNSTKFFSVHRLVAMLYLDNEHNKPEVNHKNSDKSDNHYTNLEWCTSSENQRHFIANGGFVPSEKQIASSKENIKRFHEKVRNQKSCRKGHLYSSGSLRVYDGKRHCHVCRMHRQRLRRAKLKGVSVEKIRVKE